MKVSKFGGTSLADANQIKKVLAIVRSDKSRHYIVVSAPGKRTLEDRKITDLFYEWHKHQELRLSSVEIKTLIGNRYQEIASALEIKFDISNELEEIERRICGGATADYAASRGEYLNGKILAIALGYEFVDPAYLIYFDEQDRFDRNYVPLSKALLGKKAVIPGFYGASQDGEIKTFSRGGSDITGAIVARAVGADVYENWTDVSGLLMTDPRIVTDPKTINRVTYKELRELSYMGASVFHEEAMFPVQEAGIATNIKNTNAPDDLGTLITSDTTDGNKGRIVGIAGRKNFTIITVDKTLMNQEIGFGRRILSVLEANQVNFEHMPGGIDTISVIIDDRSLKTRLEKILQEIKDICTPDSIKVSRNVSMVAIVGGAMVHTPGIAAKVLTAIASKNISLRVINQGSSEISIIIGVDNKDYEKTVRAIYEAFTE